MDNIIDESKWVGQASISAPSWLQAEAVAFKCAGLNAIGLAS